MLLNPVGSASTNVLQTITSKVTANKSSTSTTFASVLTATITKVASSNLLIWASWSFNFAYYCPVAFVRLVVDSAEVLRAGELWDQTQSGYFVYRATGLSAGARVVDLQWALAVKGDGTFRCRPATVPEGAAITVMEVSV